MRTLIALFAAALSVTAAAQEARIQLADGPGRDKVTACLACHSLDYIPMNSRFLKEEQWTAEVNKMIKVYGAPISAADAETIVRYLARHYGATE
jgi:hypothetical protein